MAWGGGTPTYLSPEQILELNNHLRNNFNLVEPKLEKPSLASLAKEAEELISNKEAKKNKKNEHEYAIEIDS